MSFIMRRLTHCSPIMDWDTKCSYMSDLNYRMYLAGYPEPFRRNITKKAVNNYNKILKEHLEENKVMYRDIEHRPKKEKSVTWYKEKGYDLNINIPATADENLKTQMKRKLEDMSRKKILISQTHGPKLISALKTTKMSQECARKKCLPCRSGENKKHARKVM